MASCVLHSTEQKLTLLTESAPPHSFEQNGRIVGSTVEIVQAIVDEIGITPPELHLYPWARAYKMLEEQENVALFPTSRTAYRESKFLWVGPLKSNPVSFYKLTSNTELNASTLEQLREYEIGSGRNDHKSQFLLSRGFKVKESNINRQSLQMLLKERLSVIVYADHRLKYDLELLGIDSSKLEKLFEIPELSVDAFIAFNKGSDKVLVNQFRVGLEALDAKGEKQKILDKWHATNKAED